MISLRFRLGVLSVLMLTGAGQLALAQGPNDPNEGIRFEFDATNSMYRFSWWSRLGRTYFVQHSEDLMIWMYEPTLIEPGSDSIKEWEVTSPGHRFFLRLRYTDQPMSDPWNADFEPDGMPTWWELAHGLDPLVADGTGDLDGDLVSNYIEYLQGRDPRVGAVADSTGAVNLLVYTPME